jgi:hypothetical protein
MKDSKDTKTIRTYHNDHTCLKSIAAVTGRAMQDVIAEATELLKEKYEGMLPTNPKSP